jgi:phytol kinase
MSSDAKGLILSFVYLFGILFLAEGIRAWKHRPAAFTRKFIHIGVGFWGLIAHATILSRWAVLIPPFAFILINSLSYRLSLFKSMESEEKPNPGTIWYPVSLFVLLALFWNRTDARIVPLIGLLVMALGDGFASLIGEKWGKHRYHVWGQYKSMEGSSAMFFFSCLAVIIVLCLDPSLTMTSRLVRGTVIAFLSTLVEGLTPARIDNLTVPMAAGLGYWFFFI